MLNLSNIDLRLLRKQYRYLLALKAKAKTGEGRILLEGVIALIEQIMNEIDPPKKSLTLTIKKK